MCLKLLSFLQDELQKPKKTTQKKKQAKKSEGMKDRLLQ